MKSLPTWRAAVWLGLILPVTALAAPASAPISPQPASKTQPAALAPEQARAALDVLKDDAQRAKLITVLEAIARTQPQGTVGAPGAAATTATQSATLAASPATADKPAEAAKPPAIVLAPNSVGAQLLFGASETLGELSDEAIQVARTVTDFPLLWNWITRLASDRQMQMAIFDAIWRLVLVLAVGLGAEWATRRALRRPMHALRERAPVPPGHLAPDVQGIADAEAGQTEWIRRRASMVSLIRRLPYAVGCFALDVLPVLAIVAAGYVLLAAGMAGGLTSRLVILAVLNAVIVWRIVIAITRAVASPDSARLRMVPLTDAHARVVVREVANLTAVALAGYVIAEAALLFGLYLLAHDALLKLNALVVYVLVVRIVLRNRRGLKQMLRARDGRTGFFAAVRNILASSWHRIIITYLGALWLVWALDIDNGFGRLLRLMLAGVAVSIVARLLSMAVKVALERLLKASEGLDEQYPGVETRLVGYYPICRAVANGVISVVALVAVFQAWGFDALSWFTMGALGGRVVAAAGTIAVTLISALVVWELVNAAIARHLAQLARNAQLARSARLRTLLPMFRTTLLVTVCLIAGLLVLSEIGVNIAPLLAGAGVIGLAIGFGSQKLVQDIITGLFLLLENAMQVGDVVALGGLSGTVENLSIRTIRLRALDGSVHIVPFSAVTTVTNNTRDYGFSVLDVSVGLNEEPDRISGVLKEIAAQMRTESPWRGLILADLDVMGVDKFIETAWVMRVRIKTLPASRWAVGRELNRRIKYRFDELAIESPITSYRVLSMATPPTPGDTEIVASSGAAVLAAAPPTPTGSAPPGAPPS